MTNEEAEGLFGLVLTLMLVYFMFVGIISFISMIFCIGINIWLSAIVAVIVTIIISEVVIIVSE